MHLTATKAKCSNGGRVTFFNAKSSQTGRGSKPPIAFKKHGRTRLPSPLGALRVSGGLLEFIWEADHQTLGEGSIGEGLCFLQVSACRNTLRGMSRLENGITVNSDRRFKNALTKGCDIQRQVQQRNTTALNLRGLLRLCLCLPNGPAIIDARLGDWSHQKRRIWR